MPIDARRLLEGRHRGDEVDARLLVERGVDLAVLVNRLIAGLVDADLVGAEPCEIDFERRVSDIGVVEPDMRVVGRGSDGDSALDGAAGRHTHHREHREHRESKELDSCVECFGVAHDSASVVAGSEEE